MVHRNVKTAVGNWVEQSIEPILLHRIPLQFECLSSSVTVLFSLAIYNHHFCVVHNFLPPLVMMYDQNKITAELIDLSNWLGAPAINRYMTRFAFPGKCGSFGASSPPEDCAFASWVSSGYMMPAKASAPKPVPTLFKKSRREG